MSAGFLRRRRARRTVRRRRWDYNTWKRILWQIHPAALTLVVSLCVSFALIGILEERLRPVLMTAARTQTQNMVTAIAEEAILSELEQQDLEYTDLVCVERGTDGTVTAITTDMAAMNRLRSRLVEVMLEHVSRIDEAEISIPVGSLVESELIWGRGPTIKVRSFTVGTVKAEFKSDFNSAGINQTLHKIWIDLSVPTTVLLPGFQLEVPINTTICIAETVIVGSVPSYIQKSYG